MDSAHNNRRVILAALIAVAVLSLAMVTWIGQSH